jgi:myo-inositol-1-phosphate synthase
VSDGENKVRVAIIGVGNCASSLVQGVHFYKDAKEQDQIPGIMHVNRCIRCRRYESG